MIYTREVYPCLHQECISGGGWGSVLMPHKLSGCLRGIINGL